MPTWRHLGASWVAGALGAWEPWIQKSRTNGRFGEPGSWAAKGSGSWATNSGRSGCQGNPRELRGKPPVGAPRVITNLPNCQFYQIVNLPNWQLRKFGNLEFWQWYIGISEIARIYHTPDMGRWILHIAILHSQVNQNQFGPNFDQLRHILKPHELYLGPLWPS